MRLVLGRRRAARRCAVPNCRRNLNPRLISWHRPAIPIHIAPHTTVWICGDHVKGQP